MEETLDDALRRKLTSVLRLRWQLTTTPWRKGSVVLRQLLDARDPSTAVPESVLETKLARILRKGTPSGLIAQHEIRANGQVLARVDFAFPDARIAIEADGYRWHSSRARWETDLARRNALTDLGWRVIHVTWSDLERPDRILARIERMLSVRP